MSSQASRPTTHGAEALDRALQRIAGEIIDGVQHGYFELTISCEVVNRGQRRLVLKAGKSYQFLLPAPRDAVTPHEGSAP